MTKQTTRYILKSSTGLVAALAVAGTASFAFAQTASTNAPARTSVFEEITVTAQKVEEKLQDVPISVTAFSGNALRELNMTNSVDIAQQTPGLSIGTPVGEGNNPSITLRGVGLNDFNDNNESPVAMYVDEVYMGSLAGQTFQLFDLERVEVLRGPQGTLFGRNATGGLVHFISKKPTKDLDYYGDLTYGRHNTVELEGAVGGSLSEKVQARLSAAYHRADGYVENRAGPDRNEKRDAAGRLQVNVDASDDFSILFNVHAARSHQLAAVYQHKGTAGLSPAFNTPECPTSDPTTDCFGYKDTDGDPWAGAYDRNGALNIDTYGGNIKMTWDLNASMTLTSISAYEHVKKLHQEDTDMSPFDRVNPTFKMTAKQYSEEIRLNGVTENLKWIVGGYFYKQKINMPQILQFGVDLDPTFYLDSLALQNTTSWAGFGQVEYNFTPALSAVVGARWTHDRKTFDYYQIDKLGGVTGQGPGFVILDTADASNPDDTVFSKGIWSGKAGLNYRPDDNWLVFASVSRGFKSGGFNAGFTDAGLSQLKYGAEKLTSYEAGFKSTLIDGLARFNATAFYYDYKDMQTLTFQGVSSFITNAASAKLKGAELELQTTPLNGLDINLGASFLDSKANGITIPDLANPGQVIELSDRETVLAPKYTFNGLARYEQPLDVGGSLSGQVSFKYQSSHYFDIRNQAGAKQGGYMIWDARVGYKLPDDRYEISFWVKNVFNKAYLAYTFDFTNEFGFDQHMYGPPRWWGLTLSFRN